MKDNYYTKALGMVDSLTDFGRFLYCAIQFIESKGLWKEFEKYLDANFEEK